MKILFKSILLLLFAHTFILKASPATEAASDLKGFFGESLVSDIYQHAGRELVPYKVNPNLRGWCVLAVSIGSYFIVDKTVKVWRRYQDSKYLTFDDLAAWGIKKDTILDVANDTVLESTDDSILTVKRDTILNL